ncbi:MAG: MFS transporter [Proteobacteria bacterium]|nr:MFS transporter [Pseudomonadota bacterium]
MSEAVDRRGGGPLRPRATLATASAAHVVHDGFSNLILLFLPVWAAELHLSLTQVGLLRAAYMGTLGFLQLPAGLLAEKYGPRTMLGVGTALVGVGYLALGFAGGFIALFLCLALAGFGSSAQHPLASTLVSRSHDGSSRRAALGFYNFAGDIGKVALPGLVGLALLAITWRQAAFACGLLGLAAALAIFLAMGRLGNNQGSGKDESRAGDPPKGWGIKDKKGFRALSAIAIIDNATRGCFLTFIPFLLTAKGASVQEIGLALSLIFGGGAFGKFILGLVAARIGVARSIVVTEVATAIGIGVILALPLVPALVVLPLVGVALNGTSTVLYGSVADLVEPERHSRAFGLFYTFVTGSGAVAPAIYGVVSDFTSVPVTLGIAAVLVLTTLPLTRLLKL